MPVTSVQVRSSVLAGTVLSAINRLTVGKSKDAIASRSDQIFHRSLQKWLVEALNDLNDPSIVSL